MQVFSRLSLRETPRQGRRHCGKGSPFSGAKIFFFLRKIEVDEKEGVDEKSDKNMT